MFCYEIEREKEFAPLKNASGNDSAETCRIFLSNLHKEHIKQAGGTISDKLKDEDLIEIDPSVDHLEDLAQRVKGVTFTKSILINQSSSKDSLMKQMN